MSRAYARFPSVSRSFSGSLPGSTQGFAYVLRFHGAECYRTVTRLAGNYKVGSAACNLFWIVCGSDPRRKRLDKGFERWIVRGFRRVARLQVSLENSSVRVNRTGSHESIEQYDTPKRAGGECSRSGKKSLRPSTSLRAGRSDLRQCGNLPPERRFMTHYL